MLAELAMLPFKAKALASWTRQGFGEEILSPSLLPDCTESARVLPHDLFRSMLRLQQDCVGLSVHLLR